MKNNYFGIIDLCSKIIFIFTAGILASKLGPGLYATWILLSGLQLLINSISSLGFSTSMQRLLPFLAESKQKFYLLFSISVTFAINIIAFFLIFIFQDEITAFYKLDIDARTLTYPLALISFIACVESIQDSYFKIREDVTRYVFFVSYKTFIELSTLLYFFKFRYSEANESVLLTYVWTLLIFKFSGYLLLLLPLFKKVDSDHKNLKSFIHYGLPTVFASCILWGCGNIDRIMLTRHMSLTDLGNYSFGASLATYITFVGSIIAPLLMTRLSYLYEKDKGLIDENFLIYFNKNLTCIILVVSGLWLLLALFSKEIILITAGSNYPNAHKSLFYLALYYGIDQIIGLWAFIFHLKKRPSLITSFRLIYFFFFVGGLYMSLKLFQSEYLVISILIMGIIYNSFIYFLSQKLLAVKMSLKNFAILICVITFSIFGHFILSQLSFYIKLSMIVILAIGILNVFFKEYLSIDTFYNKLKSKISQ